MFNHGMILIAGAFYIETLFSQNAATTIDFCHFR